MKVRYFYSTMTLRTRKSIYYSFFVLFFVVGAYLVMLTQGLVFDIAKFRIVKTGAIYLRVVPSSASILINKKPYSSGEGLLSRDTFINNLLPNTYHVEIFKDGYWNWQKNLTVQDGLVASASQVRLWKKKYAETTVASSSVKDFFLTKKGPLIQTENGNVNFGETTLKGSTVTAYSPHSAEVITKDAKGNYLFTDLGNLKSSVNLSNLFASLYKQTFTATSAPAIVDVALHPFSSGKALVAASNGVYLLNLKKISLDQSASLPRTKRLVVTDTEMFAADNAGEFSGTNLLLGSSASFSVATTTIRDTKANPSGTKFFILQKNGALLEYHRGIGTPTPVAENVKDFSISPDEKRLALVYDDNTMAIFHLEDITGDFTIPKGTVTPITIPNVLRDATITVAWLPDTGNYLLVGVNTNLFVTETDPRTPQNSSLLFSHVKKYALSGDTLYLLKSGGSLVTVAL